MRLHEQLGFDVFDENNHKLNIQTSHMTVSDIISFLSEKVGYHLFSQAKSDKEVLLWSAYGFSKNKDSKMLFRLVGNPKPCCGG